MSIADEKYIAVGTFKRDGNPVTTTCWITELEDGKVGFWTSSDTFKYKRLKNDPRITVQASDGRGRAKGGAAVLTGTAALFTEGSEFDEIQRRIRKKYGVMVHITRSLAVVANIRKGKFHYGDVGVVVTLDQPAG
jgi:hypothetical protein